MPALQLLIVLLALWLTGCASLPSEVQRPVSQALAQSEDTRLGRSIAEHIARTGQRHASGFRLLGATEAAYTSRLSLIDAADRTLDLQYYAILADPSTGQLLQRLREAAARGVRVRILLDDFNTTGANAQVLRLAFVPNIEVRLYNPLPGSRRSLAGRLLGSLGNIEQAQRRMHNKVFIADNQVGITGGRNLGDAYFGQGQESNFIDMDVLAAGRIVRAMSASFDAYWNNELAYPVQSLLSPDELDALKKPDDPLDRPDPDPGASPLDLSPARLTWAPALLLVDKADKIASEQEGQADTVVDGLLRLMATTREDLFIVSPYFVPGEAMMEVFAQLRRAGVRVRVLTNSLAATDAPLAHVGYARYRKRLLDMGVELYEMRAELGGGDSVLTAGSASMARVAQRGSESSSPRQPGAGGSVGASRASLHAKTLVLDHSLLVVGSMNLDLRSQLQNSEIALLIRSGTLARQAEDMAKPVLEQDAYRMGLEDGQLVWHAPDGPPIRTRFEPDAGLGMQWLLKLIGPLAPDEML
ncbi:phospholipase D family protein [Pseudorhodoferax aquiterrae]|uniref:Phospholipase D family protein n=1 Tax=Pseudorhodoferax aquiterrae TaxID=747304 RepID=A0ABQ3G4M0_9BURK|nr:phospholipase D family protein [Pseudorhodoferax aquiterrae]